MFYAEAILSRRGPLAKVWLAAHWERKLSKTQTLQTDISQAADAIMGQEVVPMALRLSGQLLLGVCRIYSRKAKYLLDDCNEALLKIKMAFRPGLVDLTEDQLAVNRNAITLQGDGFDLDFMIPDANWEFDFDRPIGQGQQHIAREKDITLAENHMNFGLDDPMYEFDLGGGGIGSQDFDYNIGVDFGEDGMAPADGAGAKSSRKGKDRTGEVDEEEDGMSIEMGMRDSVDPRPGRPSLDTGLHGAGVRGDFDDVFGAGSRNGMDDLGLQEDFGGDIGMDLGIGEDDLLRSERPKSPEAAKDSRASSPLTQPPGTPAPQEHVLGEAETTPRAAEDAQAIAKKKKVLKKVIIDPITELEDGPGAHLGRGGLNSQARDVSGITVQHDYLPRSRTVMALMHIRADPLAHFMPTITTERGTFFCAAPPGMPKELNSLFMFPTHVPHKPNRRERPPAASDVEGDGRSPKRARLAGDDQDVEVGRRDASVARSLGVGSDIFGRQADGGGDVSFNGLGGAGDDFQMDFDAGGGEFNIDVEGAIEDARRRASKAGSMAPSVVRDDGGASARHIEDDKRSRFSTPADGEPGGERETYADLVCPIHTMDYRPSKDGATQSTLAQPEEEEGPNNENYSKNTVKAMSILRKHFGGAVAEDVDATPRRRGQTSSSAPKALSFKKLSEKASRRAASSFFFELLLLGTKDCVNLSQEEAHGNIEIRHKEKLWKDVEVSRQASVAPSNA
ncbi:sister chromatid cohesion protein 1 [Tulasnella sp. JGI-2019a]|nr:sister chromatid cohesion protein 1 [Tulasnella sp. JGI-2019a]KAG9030496.1 sister chromatid cohesion protein 1 [Tulasnella sp. JGI-2019a]